MKKNFLKIFFSVCVMMLFTVVVKADTYTNYNEGDLLSCGNGYLTDIPSLIPKITTIIYVVVQVAVPILLVIFASIDLVKAVSSGKEDEIKKNQGIVIKRVIAAILVFFVFSVVKLIVTNISNSNVMECTSCFLDYKDSCN